MRCRRASAAQYNQSKGPSVDSHFVACAGFEAGVQHQRHQQGRLQDDPEEGVCQGAREADARGDTAERRRVHDVKTKEQGALSFDKLVSLVFRVAKQTHVGRSTNVLPSCETCLLQPVSQTLLEKMVIRFRNRWFCLSFSRQRLCFKGVPLLHRSRRCYLELKHKDLRAV